MSQPLYISVKFTAKSGYREELHSRLLEMVEITVKEDGCVFYDLYTDREDDSVFYFFECWASDAQHAVHAKAAHVDALFNDIPRLTVDGARLEFMRKKG
jgi:quinol monooxygenase YgiN